MPRTRKRSKKSGLPPGTLIHIGEKKAEKARITLIDYDESHFREKDVKEVKECFPFKDEPAVTWINVDGLHEVDIIENIGKYFDVHPLLLEDIVTTEQRPKLEDFENYILVILNMLDYNVNEGRINSEQVSLILGRNFVISFQEREGDIFNPVRERLRKEKSKIRKMGADYLAYSLIDAIVDNYFIILEKLGEKIEELEEELVTNPTQRTLKTLHNFKREMIFLRKSVWPLREVVGGLERGESLLIKDTTRIYLRDVYDHTIQVMDTVETFRDMLSGMLDIYLSSISNRMNEIIKVLTVIATIFIPLTFIAGVYGMNFRYMPELVWRWGYPAVWFVMVFVALLMLVYFRKKRWV